MKLRLTRNNGPALATTISPSGQYIRSSSTLTVMKVATLTTRKISPKERNLRMVPRSLVARESSCPDCHWSWKETGSRCRWA